jgi:hypothetical protein
MKIKQKFKCTDFRASIGIANDTLEIICTPGVLQMISILNRVLSPFGVRAALERGEVVETPHCYYSKILPPEKVPENAPQPLKPVEETKEWKIPENEPFVLYVLIRHNGVMQPAPAVPWVAKKEVDMYMLKSIGVFMDMRPQSVYNYLMSGKPIATQNYIYHPCR